MSALDFEGRSFPQCGLSELTFPNLTVDGGTLNQCNVRGLRMVTPTDDYYAAHDGGSFAPAETATVATWKAPAFLENLAVDAEGAVFLTVYSHNRIDRYDPATHTTTTFAELPAPPMGLAFDAAGVLWTTGGTLRKGPGYIWQVERNGAVREWCEFPDALFMVGSTACAFGRAPGDEKALYVTTDGGFLIPHESGIQDAKLVRMEVGESGWPLLQGA
jgi:sugar lactone lactonase YvrE